MSRQPTPDDVAYAWWRAAISGRKPPLHDAEPQCGFYARRLVKGGPIVPARIWLDRAIDDETGELIGDETMLCKVGDVQCDVDTQWIWLAAKPISEAEYNYLRRRTQWAQQHDPGHPAANPSDPVDWTRSPIPF